MNGKTERTAHELTAYIKAPYPTIPPVSGLLDFHGRSIELDAEVIVCRLRGLVRNPGRFRAKVVGMGDPGLPGREIIKIRPFGSNYIEAAAPGEVETHVFDAYRWLAAETEAADDMGGDKADGWGHVRRENRGIDLTKCMFGGFYFEEFQRRTMAAYLSRATGEEG